MTQTMHRASGVLSKGGPRPFLDDADATLWSQSPEALFTRFGSTSKGLSTSEATRRLRIAGRNLIETHH